MDSDHKSAVRCAIAVKFLITGLFICLMGCVLAGCSNAWQYARLSVRECVQSAKLAMRDADFTENLHVARRDNGMMVSGDHGGYNGLVYCWANKRKVEVFGFDTKQVEFYRNSIISRF
jgi:hypothetical protein